MSLRTRGPSRRRSAAFSCDFRPILHVKERDPHARRYRIVAVSLSRWVLKRRKRFATSDVRLRRVPGLDRRALHLYVGEFLSAWESPGPGHSRLGAEMVRLCPKLHEQVTRLWEGG